ncbi:MAG: ribonuclease HI [Candidatus Binatia bacterium]|nr:ribonuclease HI [Candidatus Binatia bacterium]
MTERDSTEAGAAEEQRPHVRVYTDGACSGNPGPGGWAAVLVSGPHRREISGFEPETTNNRMELRAAIEALRLLKRPAMVDVYTDSEYLRQGMREWLPRWKVNGWRTANRRPVKNADLWRELDRLCARHRVRWHWLRGHAGHPENERCDRLARAEISRHVQGKRGASEAR